MPSPLLQPFLDSFTKALLRQPPQDLLDIWKGKTKRTNFYKRTLRDTEKDLDLTLKPEHCRIDFVLGKSFEIPGICHSGMVPLIALESENEVDDAWEEVDKLCAINAPVKVLITCAIWSRPSQRKAPGQTPRDDLLVRWRAIHAAHPSRADDTFLVIVGERTKHSLRFFTAMLSGCHPEAITKPKPFLEIEL
jgi:hypothetical protein